MTADAWCDNKSWGNGWEPKYNFIFVKKRGFVSDVVQLRLQSTWYENPLQKNYNLCDSSWIFWGLYEGSYQRFTAHPAHLFNNIRDIIIINLRPPVMEYYVFFSFLVKGWGQVERNVIKHWTKTVKFVNTMCSKLSFQRNEKGHRCHINMQTKQKNKIQGEEGYTKAVCFIIVKLENFSPNNISSCKKYQVQIIQITITNSLIHARRI